MSSQPFQLRMRQPGEPQTPSVAGAPPMPSMPNTTVASPAAASAPIGRPPMPVPSPPGGPGPFPPPSPGTASTAAPGARQTSPAASPGPAPGGAASAPTPAPAGPGDAGGGFGYHLDHVPSAAERATLPPGMRVTTPYGEIGEDGQLVQTPETAAAHQAKVLEVTKKYGWHPGADDPLAPQPVIRLGRQHFNPFTNQWVQG
jgi:hypothetical protein